jgi:hypothetical protein
MAAKMAIVLDDDFGGGPADETARSGIGGTGYAIGLGYRAESPPALSSGITPPREDGAAALAHR